MRKKNFLLIEILIAFALVSLCMVPLVSGPLKLHKLQTVQLIKMEKERLAEWTFCEIKEMFLKNEIPWSTIPPRGEKSMIMSISDGKVEIPGLEPRKITRKFFLTKRGEKEGSSQIVRSVGVYVLLDKDQYEFRIPIFMKKKKNKTPV